MSEDSSWAKISSATSEIHGMSKREGIFPCYFASVNLRNEQNLSFILCHSFFQNKLFTTIPGRSVQIQKYDFQREERYIPKESAQPLLNFALQNIDLVPLPLQILLNSIGVCNNAHYYMTM